MRSLWIVLVAACGSPKPTQPPAAPANVLARSDTLAVLQLPLGDKRFAIAVGPADCRARSCSSLVVPEASETPDQQLRVGIKPALWPGVAEITFTHHHSGYLQQGQFEERTLVRPGSPPAVLCSFPGHSRTWSHGKLGMTTIVESLEAPDHLIVVTSRVAHTGCSRTKLHLTLAPDGSCTSREEALPVEACLTP